MQIDRNQIVELLTSRGEHDEAVQAESGRPAEDLGGTIGEPGGLGG